MGAQAVAATTGRRRRIAAAVTAIALTGGLAACGGDDEDGSAGGGGDGEEVELQVSLFGNFGYGDAGLYDQFEKDHPGVTITESAEGDLGRYNEQLVQRIAGGGAGDVVAIEEGQIVNFLQSPGSFVDFQDHGSEEMKDQWLDWKYQQATTADGSATIGLGTDVGGLAMCYRQDLFKRAGLPSDREEVSALWPTWDDFVEIGKQFEEGIGDEKVNFVDSSTNTYNSILMQSGEQTYFDTGDNLIIEQNPAVKEAWDQALAMDEAGLTAELQSFTPEWNAGFKNGAFATIACPAWMTGYIKDQAGEPNAGKWDIATIPGGGGNWGGSFLAVPSDSENQDLAIELVKFLTSADSQLAVFEAVGNLPSNPTLYDTPELAEATNEYFNDAPVGELFVAGAEQLEPVYLGSKNQPVRDVVETAMRSAELGERSPEEAWEAAVADAATAAG
jgi:cellobiose transport system substrate-binding protein